MTIVFKKGVSPLIATILLIAFAVALGSVVMQWGLRLNLGQEPDKCRPVEVKFRELDDGSEVCYGGYGHNGYINFIIANSGGSDVHGLAILITGEKSTSLFDLDGILIKRGDVYGKIDEQIKYDFITYGNIKNLQFIPKLKVSDSYEVCPRSAIKATSIGVCD